jgi:hypothetical protein
VAITTLDIRPHLRNFIAAGSMDSIDIGVCTALALQPERFELYESLAY